VENSVSRSALLRRYARRVAGGLAGLRFGPQLRSDWRNLRDLASQPAAARAECPICGYRGVFLDHAGRRRQVCPGCGSRARHRALHLALGDYVLRHALPRTERALHFAPEACLQGTVAALAERVVTADLEPGGVDLALDICRLPFRDGCFGLVIASHVLEHVVDDRGALSEIRRVLEPGGLALLLVPVTVEKTIEFGAADPLRNDHVRDCGPDYFERYRETGFELELERSDRLPGADRHALLTLDGESSLPHYLPFCRRP
jgi:SAM-dependent methyltransferase